MRVVFPHDFADGAGRFAELLVGGVAALKHAVEDTAVNRLEAVPSIRKRTSDDDGHGVIDVGILHFRVQRMIQDDLTRTGCSVVDVVIVVVILRCQGWSPP